MKWYCIWWRAHYDLFRTRNSKFRTWDLTWYLSDLPVLTWDLSTKASDLFVTCKTMTWFHLLYTLYLHWLKTCASPRQDLLLWFPWWYVNGGSRCWHVHGEHVYPHLNPPLWSLIEVTKGYNRLLQIHYPLLLIIYRSGFKYICIWVSGISNTFFYVFSNTQSKTYEYLNGYLKTK